MYKMGVVVALLLATGNTAWNVYTAQRSKSTVAVVDLQRLLQEEIDAGARLHLEATQRLQRASVFNKTLERALNQLQAENADGVVLVAPAVLSGGRDYTDWVRRQLKTLSGDAGAAG